MKSLKILLISLSIIIANSLIAQSFDFDKTWRQVEKLEKNGLFNQASEHCNSIFLQAKKQGNSMQMVKSLIYKSNYRNNYEEDAFRNLLLRFKTF